MDEKFLELASEVTLAEAKAGVERVLSAIPKKPHNFDGRCSCGEDIPEKRLATGAYTCLECQQTIERKRSLTK